MEEAVSNGIDVLTQVCLTVLSVLLVITHICLYQLLRPLLQDFTVSWDYVQSIFFSTTILTTIGKIWQIGFWKISTMSLIFTTILTTIVKMKEMMLNIIFVSGLGNISWQYLRLWQYSSGHLCRPSLLHLLCHRWHPFHPLCHGRLFYCILVARITTFEFAF